MQGNVDILTLEKNIEVIYGMFNLREEREEARTSLKYMLNDVNNLKKYYFLLGFHLCDFQNNKYYEDFGYDNIYDFCDSNLGMCKTAVSNCINVYVRFCDVQDGVCRVTIQDKYKDYSYSQLCEMLPLTDAQLVGFTPDVSVSRMREMKKNMKESARTMGVVSVDSPVVQTSERNKLDQVRTGGFITSKKINFDIYKYDSFDDSDFRFFLWEFVRAYINSVVESNGWEAVNFDSSGKVLNIHTDDAVYRLTIAKYKN